MPAPRILLDECIDRRLAREIPGHTATTVPEAGWAGLSNGELLSQAQHSFDVFVTVDQNLSTQQDISKYNISVIVLRGQTSRLQDLLPLIPTLLQAIESAEPGICKIVGS